MKRLQKNRRARFVAIGAFAMSLGLTVVCICQRLAAAGNAIPWDFKPYNVKVWIVSDGYEPVDLDSIARQLDESFYQSPGPAWQPVVEQPPAEIRQVIRRSFDSIQYKSLVARDPVFAMKRNHPMASSVRSIATAGERLAGIPGSEYSVNSLKEASVTIPRTDWRQFLESLSFDDEGKLHIAGAANDGGEAVIKFTETFAARLKNAIDDFAASSISSSQAAIKRLKSKESAAKDQTPPADGEEEEIEVLDLAEIQEDLEKANKRLEVANVWKGISDKLSLTEEGLLAYQVSEEGEPVGIPLAFVLTPVRKALESEQAWLDFRANWRLDEDETLWLKLTTPNLWMPLPDRVFKDFYLKSTRDDGVKSPDGAVGLDNREDFVNQQILIDSIRNMIISGDGWQAFASRLVVSDEGTLQMETDWANEDSAGTMIVSRGFAEALVPEAKIIDPKIPGAIEPILADVDKVFLVNVETEHRPFTVSVRELDCPMQLMGPIIDAKASSSVDLANTIARATLRAFSPIVRLENVGKKIAKGQIRAGGLIVKQDPATGEWVPDNDSPAAISEGDWLRPVIRRVDRYGNPSLLEIVDFAYLKVLPPEALPLMFRAIAYTGLKSEIDFDDDEALAEIAKNLNMEVRDGRIYVDGEELDEEKRRLEVTKHVGYVSYSKKVRAVLNERFENTELRKTKIQMEAHAGRVGTLQGRSDRRTTRIGMKIRPFFEETVVRMHAQRDPTRPLIGYDVYEKHLVTGKLELIDRSDWDGRIWLGKGDTPMRLLYVKNGRSVLARLPVVPGQSTLEVADIPADDLRLRAEAYLKGVENEIVDQVAIRSLLSARIRIRLEKGKVDEANELFDQLNGQPNYEKISTHMDETSLVIRTEDKFRQRTIGNMFKRTGDMLRKHISPVLISEVQRDIVAVENGEQMPSKANAEEE